MSADLSRVRFDPLRDHSGIGIQQGRLWLDADFNEQVAITDRRLRAQVVDLSPSPTVVSRLTPKAFEITVTGGNMSIGGGRMYVDGLLAENHGVTPTFDPVLAESNGTGVIDYFKQPYWLTPTSLPTGGPHLVYLDVWERELTHLNTPDLVDSAIGVDTTTRTQIVWQVRVLPEVGANTTCDSVIPKWTELMAPSSARLTTGTADVDPVDDPCEVPPGKGYRGPENQLYRVELHSPTQFTWSRDNATVASGVAEVVSATSLRLERLGRDDVLRIKENDWVEITDERRELNQLSGEMRQVHVDVATSMITFAPALPADLVTNTVHLRVRKWDSPLINVPMDGSAVSLEHGVTVSFSSVNTGDPRPGDHWVFAARATAPSPEESLEKLVAAPPRGIHHHYARLALVTMPGTLHSDCRPDWPVAGGDSCACETCVTPDLHNNGKFTIQDAIEMLKKAPGGAVTLCPGTYRLDKPLLLNGAKSITVRGAGQSSILAAEDIAVVLSTCVDVSLERFAVRSTGAVAILLEGATLDCRLEGLLITPDAPQVAVGLTGPHQGLSIRRCRLGATTGIGVVGPEQADGAELAVMANLFTQGLSIEDNFFHCKYRAVDLSGICEHTGLTSISGNSVHGCSDAGILVTGLIPHDADGKVGTSGTLNICRNVVDVEGSGIVTGGRAHVIENTVITAIRRSGKHGIVLDAQPPDTPDGIAHVLANEVSGFGGFGITIAAQMLSLVIKQNIVRGTGGGIAVLPKVYGGNVAIDNNQILDLKPVGEEGSRVWRAVALVHEPSTASAAGVAHHDEPTVVVAPSAPARRFAAYVAPKAAGSLARASTIFGIAVVGAGSVSIVGNTVDGVSADEQDAGETRLALGIVVYTCTEARVTDNTVSRIGHPAAMAGNAYGLYGAAWQDTLSVSDNIVLSGAGPRPVVRPGWTALNLPGTAGQRLGAIRSVDTVSGNWTFLGNVAYLQRETVAHIELNGNVLQGGADDVAVVVLTGGDVVMNGNRCAQPGTAEQQVVRMTAGVAIVQGNRLLGGHPSMTMTVDPDAAAVLGNITSGGIQINGSMVDNTNKPWSSLNSIA